MISKGTFKKKGRGGKEQLRGGLRKGPGKLPFVAVCGEEGKRKREYVSVRVLSKLKSLTSAHAPVSSKGNFFLWRVKKKRRQRGFSSVLSFLLLLF